MATNPRVLGKALSVTPAPFLMLLIALAVLPGCTSIEVTYIDPAHRPEAEAAAVRVLREEPLRPYKVVARFQFRDKGWNFSREQLDQRIRTEAAQLGGEAVLVEQQVQSHFLSEGLLIGHTAEVSQLVIYARVIVFSQSDAR
jgi:flavin-dependent dehydrogenase